MVHSDLNGRARELDRAMRLRTPPWDVDDDLAKVDAILGSGAELIDPTVAVSLLNHKADTLSAAGREEDAAAVRQMTVERYSEAADPAVRHGADLALMHLADGLITSLGRADDGGKLAVALHERFRDGADDRFLAYKGEMLMQLAHLLLAVQRPDAVRSITMTVHQRLDGGDDTSQAVAAEALFYFIHATAQDGDPHVAADKIVALLDTGEPGLQALDRIAGRFGRQWGDNPTWIFQVDLNRAMILMQLERLNEARALLDELDQRASHLTHPPEFRAQLEDIRRELANVG